MSCTKKWIGKVILCSGMFAWGCSTQPATPVVPDGPSATEKQEMGQREDMMQQMMKTAEQSKQGVPGPGGGMPGGGMPGGLPPGGPPAGGTPPGAPGQP